MKKLILYICLLFIFPISYATPSHASDPIKQDYIIIISSYREEIKWSTELADRVEAGIKRQYPGVRVHTDYLNSDLGIGASAIDVKFRTIFRSVINESENTQDALDLSYSTIFKNISNYPRLIILIGNEAWSYYRSYWHNMDKWIDTPVILAAVNDSTLSSIWAPPTPIKWSDLQDNTQRELSLDIDIHDNSLKEISFDNLNSVTLKGRLNDSIQRFAISHSFNVTGVIIPDMIRENIEMIKRLKPDVKEIIFADYDFYSSQYAYRKLLQIGAEYPDLQFSLLPTDNKDPDAFFGKMMSINKDKAILTYSWSVDPEYSAMSLKKIDSLFSHNQSAPIFSLMPDYSNNEYKIGGTHFSLDESVDKVVTQAIKILKGEDSSNIPFQYAQGNKISLNKQALKNYRLAGKAKKISGVTYRNIPLSFFKRNEAIILTIFILLSIILAVFCIFFIKHLYNKRKEKEYLKYKSLYNELQLIYDNTNIDFSIYNQKGNLIIKIENQSKTDNRTDILTNNIFTNPYLSSHIKEELKRNRPVNTEISVDTLSKEDNPLDKEFYHLIVKPLSNNQYKGAQFMAISLDVTSVMIDQRAREKYEKLLTFASDTFKVGVAYYDLIDGTGYANNFWYVNFGEEPKNETIINPTYKYVSSPERVSLIDYMQKARKELMEPFQMNLRVQGEDGAIHWIMQYIYQVRLDASNENIHIVELNINIDLQKQSEIRLSNAKKESEKAIKETEEFLANISHEIRTPLNAILGFSNILSQMPLEKDEKKQMSDIIKKNNTLLLQLINDILELSKFDAGIVEFNFSNINLNELIRNLCAEYKGRIPSDKPVILTQNIPDTNYLINSDNIYLTHLLKHLLSNAIKFTDVGSISCGYIKNDDHYYFFVQDSGIGIPLEKQDCVFRRFEKIDSFVQGSGLGLSLCKSIVSALGGEMGLKSRLGEGSLFWFTLPVENPHIKSNP